MTPDELALTLIASGDLTVDVDAGAVWRNGHRAEELIRNTGYGRVCVARRRGHARFAMAHRVVWLAAFGPIPPRLQVNHRNRVRWDNRIANLELVSPTGNMRHARGLGYERIAADSPADIALLREMQEAMRSGQMPDLTAMPKDCSPYGRKWDRRLTRHTGTQVASGR